MYVYIHVYVCVDKFSPESSGQIVKFLLRTRDWVQVTNFARMFRGFRETNFSRHPLSKQLVYCEYDAKRQFLSHAGEKPQLSIIGPLLGYEENKDFTKQIFI